MIRMSKPVRIAMIVTLLFGSVIQIQAQAQTEPVKKASAKQAAKAKNATPKRPLIKATQENVAYGKHFRQVVDFYKADSTKPTPVVLFIHGGGWVNGDKSGVQSSLDLAKLLKNGISVVSVQYRMVPDAQKNGIQPPGKWPLEDAKRALQFVRSKSGEWNIDKIRIAACGGSAGACSSLWLAMHDDMSEAKSDDPVARESSRLWGAVVAGAQTQLDPKMTRQWMPNMAYGGHAFGFRSDKQERSSEFQRFYDGREQVLPWIREYSPMELLTRDDPPMILIYTGTEKVIKGQPQTDPTHSPLLGKMLAEKAEPLGVRAVVSYPAEPNPDYKNLTDSLMKLLNESR